MGGEDEPKKIMIDRALLIQRLQTILLISDKIKRKVALEEAEFPLDPKTLEEFRVWILARKNTDEMANGGAMIEMEELGFDEDPLSGSATVEYVSEHSRGIEKYVDLLLKFLQDMQTMQS